MPKFPFTVCFRLLQAGAFSVFLGRAWQHLYWDAPYRALFWDERLMRRPVKGLLGMEWSEYVTHPATDAWISLAILVSGGIYLLAAVSVLFLPRWPRLTRPIILIGGILLVFLAFLYAKEKSYLWAQFFEYSLQFGAPFFLLSAKKQGLITRKLTRWMMLAVALTFTCHGLFAMGIFPTPGYFVEMVMRIVGLSQGQALSFLKVAGALDIVLSVALLFPHRIALPALAYAVFWGTATTLARVWAYFDWMHWQSTLAQWLHESVMRVPHVVIPLCLVLLFWPERGRRTVDS